MRCFELLLRSAICLAVAVWLADGVTAAEPNSAGACPVSFRQPELPRQYVDTTMPAQNGNQIRVRQGDSLQAAIDTAVLGDTIVLEAGARWSGGFTLPKKMGEGWIILKSSAEDRLPPPGSRATPADAPRMAKIVSDGNWRPALRAAPAAGRWRFVGIEFTAAPEVAELSAIVELSHQSTALGDVPSHFVFDRVYIHGNPRLNSQRGLTINSRSTAVIDSWISECHFHGADSQAICCWNGPGPFKIVNNFLEGGAENIMFGGAKNTAECMVAADIEIRRNHFYKNPAWFPLKYPNNWVIKNLFEIKTARRVLLEANVLEIWFDSFTAAGVDAGAYRLLPSSKAKGAASDGTDPGADVDAVMAATSGVPAQVVPGERLLRTDRSD